MNDIALICEASSEIGLGHLRRVSAIDQEIFRGKFDESPHQISLILDANKRYYVFEYKKKCPTTFCGIGELREHIKKSAYKLVLLDVVNFDEELILDCKRNNILSVALDYFKLGTTQPNLIITLLDHAEIFRNKSEVMWPPILSGSQYAIINSDFIASRRQRESRPIADKLKKIIISFGGSDGSGNTLKALDIIKTWPGFFDITVIIGPFFHPSVVNAIEGNVNLIEKLEVIRNPASLAIFFAETDLIFCGGGTTLLEAMCVGLPALVMPQTQAEYKHALYIKNLGGCLIEDDSWMYLESAQSRIQISKQARLLVDGLGGFRIKNELLQLLRSTKK